MNIHELTELLHDCGVDAFTAPKSRAASEWQEYRQKVAQALLDRGLCSHKSVSTQFPRKAKDLQRTLPCSVHGFFQFSHPGGSAYPVAVVEYESGTVLHIPLELIEIEKV